MGKKTIIICKYEMLNKNKWLDFIKIDQNNNIIKVQRCYVDFVVAFISEIITKNAVVFVLQPTLSPPT